MTELIARIAGPYLLLTGIGFFISNRFYARMVSENGTAHPVTLNLSGAAHFIVGMVILTQHFRFGHLPEIVVSLTGAAAVLKGASLIAVPELTLKSPKTSAQTLYASGAGFVLVGAYLGYIGYL